ncbi:MAG: 16S rRNA (uracil(1498)-N(3))-methyltransferase [Bacteroidota bacterium]
MQLFFTPDIDINSEIVILNKEESKHIVRVLRLKEGETIHLTDGNGNLLTAEISNANQKACEVKILEVKSNHEKRDYYVHIAVAPTKNNDRYEWFLEKATEIGIDEITPIIGDRSERKVVKIERFNKVILSAVKQSLKAYIPKINNSIKLRDFLKNEFNSDKYIAHLVDDDRKSLKNEIKPGRKYLILIGPEGDFSPEEVDIAISKGFTPVTLGNFRLRTETAALVAVHSIAFANE